MNSGSTEFKSMEATVILRNAGRRAILEWSVAAALIILGVLTLPSIGFLVLPLGLIACAVAAWRNHAWPDAALGTLSGAAGVCVLVAFLNLGYLPCVPGSVELARGQMSYCGGMNPVPW